MNRTFVILTLFTSLLLSQRPANASEELREKISELAGIILKTTRSEAVTVGVFSPTNLPESNVGPGLETLLTSALEELSPGIVRSDARFEVKGDYAFSKSRDPQLDGLKVIKIRARIIEKEFAEDLLQVPLEVTLDGTNSIAEVVQPTAKLDPEGEKKDRNQDLEEAQENPSVLIHGGQQTLVSSAAGSSYAVEILAKPLADHEKNESAARPVKVIDGRAFVDIQRDELYEIRLYNFSEQDAAVSVTIDGLDVFNFSEDRREDGRPQLTHFVVPARSTSTVVGWHKTSQGSENFLSFLVTEYGAGASSKANSTPRGDLGVIHVQFAHCLPLKAGAAPRSGNETGFGPPRQVDQAAVSYEVEPPHDFVTVRYQR